MSESLVRLLSNFVDGRFRDPDGGEYLDDLNPATGEVIARIPRSAASDVDEAARAARSAFEGEWGRTNSMDRAALLDKIADGIEGRADELANLESQDSGKPIQLARSVDIPRAVANFRFFAGAVRHDSTTCHSMSDALNYTLRRPLGVAGLITPWNLPLYLLSWKTAPALGVGNAVIAKPSELTPLTASALAEIIDDVGLPAGAFNLVHGLGSEAGQAIVEDERVDMISFTGGTATGAVVARTAAPKFKKLSLELGGKNPTLVFADADLDLAIEGACRAGFLNQGQICLCGSRILVERKILDSFVTGLVERVRDLEPGDPSLPETRMGALVSAAHRDKIEGYVSLARDEGGTILCGGSRPKLPGRLARGAFFQPTVVVGLSPTCRTSTEEIFGPVVTVHPFDSEEEAIDIANGVRYGLAASLWTRDLVRAHRISAALESGMVWVNTWLKRDLRVPFGGMKDSGVGREGGWLSLDAFSELRNVCIELGPLPYS